MEKNELIDKTIELLIQMKDLPKSVNLEEENRFLKEKLALDELYTSGKMPYAEYKIKITELNRMKNIEMFREYQ